MDNLSFYEHLENTKTIKGKRELISSLLKNSDLVSLFGDEVKNARLLEDLALPSDPNNKLSLPFAVGFKYQLDEPYDYPKKHFAYILGIVELSSEEKNLLTVCDGESGFCSLRRGHFYDPLYT